MGEIASAQSPPLDRSPWCFLYRKAQGTSGTGNTIRDTVVNSAFLDMFPCLVVLSLPLVLCLVSWIWVLCMSCGSCLYFALFSTYGYLPRLGRIDLCLGLECIC